MCVSKRIWTEVKSPLPDGYAQFEPPGRTSGRSAAKRTAAKFKVEVVPVGRIVFGAQNGAETLAGAAVDRLQKLALLARRIPAVLHGDPPAVGKDKARYVDRLCA